MENLSGKVKTFEIGEGQSSRDSLVSEVANRLYVKGQTYSYTDEDGYEVYPDCDYSESLL